jgi:hypothetical protein
MNTINDERGRYGPDEVSRLRETGVTVEQNIDPIPVKQVQASTKKDVKPYIWPHDEMPETD